MKLSAFIRQEREKIAGEWCDFARKNIEATKSMSEEAVLDGIMAMLDHIANDMEVPQTPEQQKEKSEGNKPDYKEDLQAAESHGEERMEMDFSLMDASAEFRALRATIIRLWQSQMEEIRAEDLQDIIRFNEVIDETWMESVVKFQSKMEESKNLLLGVLGHDLRNPLSAVSGTIDLLTRSQNLSDIERELVFGAKTSIRRMEELITNLLELTRFQLGSGIAIKPGNTDLVTIAKDITREALIAYPEATFRLNTPSSLEGLWDGSRLGQILSNLVSNALRHGQPDGPVTITILGKDDRAILKVHNEGPPISERERKNMFSGMFQEDNWEPDKPESVGLGLFIVNQIVKAHKGEIQLESSEETGTTFIVALSRH